MSKYKGPWLALAGIAGLLASASMPAAELTTLDLERRCGQCHDVADTGGLATDDWLERLKGMGRVEDLDAAQQAEVLGFLRYHGWELAEIESMASQRHLFEEKCSLCHAANRSFVKAFTSASRRATIDRMRRRAPEWISADEAQIIYEFLEAGARGVRKPEHHTIRGTPGEAFRERCSACHPLERSYLYLEARKGTDPAWRTLIKRMQMKAPEWISDEEADEIYAYLSAQKPQL